MAVSINAETFARRFQTLLNEWKDGTGWNGASAFVVVTGQPTEELRYYVSSSLHLWLLGYEFTDTVMAFTKTQLHVLAGAKKVGLLQPLEGAVRAAGLELVLHTKPKKEDGAAEMAPVVAALRGAAVVGGLPRESPTGPTVETWNAALASAGVSLVDVTAGLARAMAVKDEEEIKNIKKAGYLASAVLSSHLVKEIEGVIDADQRVRQSKLAEKAEDVILNPSKINIKLKADAVDIAYPPVIQSGGRYDARLTAGSSDEPLSYDVIVCQLGVRYASYCATVGRTLFVNPPPRLEAEYAALCAAHAAAVDALVEGAPLAGAHAAAVAALRAADQAGLVDALAKNVGTGIGLDLRDGSSALTASASGTVRAGAAFHVCLAVNNLEVEREGKKTAYAMLVADTVVVRPGGVAPELTTLAATKDWEEVAYFFNDDDEEEEEDEEEEDAKEDTKKSGRDQPLRQIDPQDLAGRRSHRTEQVDFKLRDEERRRQQENQEALLERVKPGDAADADQAGRRRRGRRRRGAQGVRGGQLPRGAGGARQRHADRAGRPPARDGARPYLRRPGPLPHPDRAQRGQPPRRGSTRTCASTSSTARATSPARASRRRPSSRS
ncbi:hypothetical protein QBZ16_001037 [Prototheca wickerhamii]|uniref:FACT complex subunit n=1 Tax=Prototheca wickerhamii TaxID=3111 RepID=A0AAD9IFC5_PROWI|nr:hypothetical protein QBZ16_001037 [Prototheca wickerhamii]